ncbi:hypothetical protein PPYR_11062 [Photinus pyralis]|uniref:Uncharacterized protein n=1 Tax=Photinus pyralis TaxID=7054 RepID=A0A5N4AI60_PHOPY|nr:uncharacterized protein LOC116172975 [Photinus pyralis]KAB0797001.1 hypothetical protein PPYR_11062 [Photinus pyralis]
MKTIGLLLLYFAVYATAVKVVPKYIRVAWYRSALPFADECICRTGVLARYATNVFLNADYPSDSCLKCYVRCIYIRLHYMNSSNGTWNADEISRTMKGMTPKITENCIKRTRNIVDDCEKAFQLFLCAVYALQKVVKG